MPYITNAYTKEPADIFYQDVGMGQPVVLIHGWLLSHRAWEGQVAEIVEAGYRCISYDRRGFGLSSATWDAYDYSSLTNDLRSLILQLDLKDVILCGFSMGGGEVVRYFSDYGNDRIAKVALISSIVPLVLKKEDNPDGVDESDLNGIMDALRTNRLGFLKAFARNYYNFETQKERMSEAQLDYDFSIASHASPRATLKCAEAWAFTDFREELKNVTVPTLIVHGDADQIVPIKSASDQAAKGISTNEYKVLKDAPHGLNITHRKELNELPLQFFRK